MVWLGFKKMLAGGFRLISEALVESCGEDVGNTYLALLHQCCGLKGERYLSVLCQVWKGSAEQERALPEELCARTDGAASLGSAGSLRRPRQQPLTAAPANCSNRCLYSVRLWFFSAALCYLRKEGSTSLCPSSMLQQIRDVPIGYNHALYLG